MNKSIVTAGLAASIAFALGAGAMWFYVKDRPEDSGIAQLTTVHVQEQQSNPFDHPFFKSAGDPFTEIERIRQQLDSTIAADHFPGFGQGFSGQYRDLGVPSIEMQDTADKVTYKLAVNPKDLVDLTVRVDNGYLSVDATTNATSDNQVFQSHISQRLEVPANVDPGSLAVDKDTDIVTITFTKKVV